MTANSHYLVGMGMADITGEPGGVGMMGYAMPHQRTAGIHTRQWARAFVIADATDPISRLVFVNCDLGMVFQGIRLAVLARLAEELGSVYGEDNVALSATHTHSGSGGYSHYTLYNLTTLGFRERAFAAIVDGIVTAITRAHHDLSPTDIHLSSGEFPGMNVNRSILAFERNPQSDRDAFPAGCDSRMNQLTFLRAGRPVGLLNWFPIHGTSMSNRNRLISADNKGFAAWLWEAAWNRRTQQSRAQGEPGFVAGFAQSNAGDMSPNVGAGDSYGPADDDFANTRITGQRQAEAAAELAASATSVSAGQVLSGPVRSATCYVDFSRVRLDPEWAPPGHNRTWPATIGQGFTGGTNDGKGLPFIKPGRMTRHPLFRLVDTVVARPPQALVDAHAPKPIGLATGLCQPVPWTPAVLPLQILRIGQLAIVCAPGEFTVVAGQRVRQAVAQASEPGTVVVFAGYANSYAGYVTTFEEYQTQHYEGASTHFGPATLSAYQQEFSHLARAVAEQTPLAGSAQPLDASAHTFSRDPRDTWHDQPGRGRRFGDTLREPERIYQPGDTVRTRFVAANPNNNLLSGQRRSQSHLEVVWDSPDGPVVVAGDDDWQTQFHWRRVSPHSSRAELLWTIPQDAATGTYWLVYHGVARTANGSVSEFSGRSRPFQIARRRQSHAARSRE